MMNVLDYAKLAFDVYQKKSTLYTRELLPMRGKLPEHGLYRLKSQFPRMNPLRPFYAQLYLQFSHGKAIAGCVSYRGTDNWDNDKVDTAAWYKSVLEGNSAKDSLPGHHYVTDAAAFYHHASRYVRQYYPELRHSLNVTGHSLGGALAALVTLACNAPAQAITFNAPQVGTIPGVKPQNAKSLLGIEARYDFVSKIGKPMGEIIKIDVPNREAEAKAAFEANAKASQYLEAAEHASNGFEAQVDMDEFKGEMMLAARDAADSALAQHAMKHVLGALKEACYSELAGRLV